MNRIIDDIPYELQGVKDYQQIGLAVDSYTESLFEELEQINKNRNILTADDDTVKMYEEILVITPQSDATLEERRYAIWLKMTSKIPYTEQWLRHWLNNLLGKDNYSLVFDYANYSFTLKITLSDSKNFDSIVAMLDTIVPAHINYIVTYLFNTWQQVKNRGTWQDIKDFGTWEDIRKSEDL